MGPNDRDDAPGHFPALPGTYQRDSVTGPAAQRLGHLLDALGTYNRAMLHTQPPKRIPHADPLPRFTRRSGRPDRAAAFELSLRWSSWRASTRRLVHTQPGQFPAAAGTY